MRRLWSDLGPIKMPKTDTLDVRLDLWIRNSKFPCIQWTHAVNGKALWAPSILTALLGGQTHLIRIAPQLRHTHTRRENLTLSATTKKTHTRRRKPQWSIYSRMTNSSAARFSPIASDVVELAEKLALASNSIFIGTDHLLQALLSLPNRYPLWHMYYDFGKRQTMETLLRHFPLREAPPKEN